MPKEKKKKTSDAASEDSSKKVAEGPAESTPQVESPADATPQPSPEAEGTVPAIADTRSAAEFPEQENARLRDQLLRLQADFENYRRRVLRDQEQIVQRANEALLEELLPVVDHMELALAAAPDPDDSFVKGVRLVLDQMLAVLSKFELTPVDAHGQPFDPNLHEAISHLPSPDVAENTVMQQTRRGYLLGKRLLRPAQVVVSSGRPGNHQQPAEQENGS